MDIKGNKHILFLGKRNESHSVMADRITKKIAADMELENLISCSKGTDAVDSHGIPVYISKYLEELNGKETKHEPDQVSIEDILDADMIIMMDRPSRTRLREITEAGLILSDGKNFGAFKGINKKSYLVEDLICKKRSDVCYVDGFDSTYKILKGLAKTSTKGTMDILRRYSATFSAGYDVAIYGLEKMNSISKMFRMKNDHIRFTELGTNICTIAMNDLHSDFVDGKRRASEYFDSYDVKGVFGIDKVDPLIKATISGLNSYEHSYTFGRSCGGHVIDTGERKGYRKGEINIIFDPTEKNDDLFLKLRKISFFEPSISFDPIDDICDPYSGNKVINAYRLSIGEDIIEAEDKVLSKMAKDQTISWKYVQKAIENYL